VHDPALFFSLVLREAVREKYEHKKDKKDRRSQPTEQQICPQAELPQSVSLRIASGGKSSNCSVFSAICQSTATWRKVPCGTSHARPAFAASPARTDHAFQMRPRAATKFRPSTFSATRAG
jgi:hypothetical protein